MPYDPLPGGFGRGLALGPPLTPAVRRLLAATVGVFIAQKISGGRLDPLLGLVPGLAVGRLFVWQFATYIFLHANALHLLFNMFVLWMFGRDVEMALGSRRFTFYYLACGVGAGAISAIAYRSGAIIIGASGAIFGLMVAFAMLFPERVVTLLVFFVLPVNMRAKHLVLLFAGIELLLIIAHAGDDFIAHFAHLGGALCGFLLMRYYAGGRRWPSFGRRGRGGGARAAGPVRSRARIDEILDKISRYGMASLTDDEIRDLTRAKDGFD
ncbi:MAG: rhomboid family intramembrane serine protease [bacterium]|nr:rhomboid family intramembrane serine protease [bacterium]